MKFHHLFILTSIALSLPFSCGSGENQDPQEATVPNKEFEAYWNQGLAELNSYQLSQARYGEYREAEAVLIYVTEPFSKSKQVKLDNPSGVGSDLVQVLKLNATRKFLTGIYPYSMMSSSFLPTDAGSTGSLIKANCSSQEWCGHTFSQWNKRSNGYELHEYSYFESEGDSHIELNDAILEDELWTLLRINPDLISDGEVSMIPGQFYSRLRHIKPSAFRADVRKMKLTDGTSTLSVTYLNLDRSLTITYSSAFPYTIESWEETYTSGWGESAEKMTSRAVLKQRMMLDYWNHNQTGDEALRDQLGL